MKVMKKILNYTYIQYLRCHKSVILHQGTVIDYRCEIEEKSNITMGQKSILYKHVTIYKSIEGIVHIGDFSHVAPYGYFLIGKQKLHIGNNVAIGPFCSIFCSSNDIPANKDILFKDSYKKADVNIGNNVFIGAQCVILPGTVIEDNVAVAAHSTVKGILKSGYAYGGNPAVVIKKVDE